LGASRRNWLRIAVVTGALAVAWGMNSAIQPALAGFGSGCTGSGSVTFEIDPHGTSIAVSLGFHDTAAVNDSLGERHNTAGKHGEPWDGFSSCSLSTGEKFDDVTALLGDQSDSLRMDAGKPKPPTLPDPIPKYVVATVHAGKGNDEVTGHKGIDEIYGEGGSDHIDVNHGGADSVDCGGGSHDVVKADPSDTLSRCETVK
jgi:hypothetical protein